MNGLRFGLSAAALAAATAFAPSPARADAPTFHRDVERLLRKHCQECHRPGQVAPFSLLTYEQAKKRSKDLANVCEDRLMPPWHASTTEGGPFKDARVLSKKEIETLTAWAEAGAPKGDEKDAPEPPKFDSDWPLGEPDLILKPSEAYTLGATGPDEFRVFVIPSGLTEGRWIRAVDYKPGNRKVVHHIIGAVDSTGRAKLKDAAEPGPGYKSAQGFGTDLEGRTILPVAGLSGWAPGKSPTQLPAGVGRYIPKGSDVMLQVHYHKSGKEEKDATAVGLYFAKDETIVRQVLPGIVFPPRKSLAARPDLLIPAGAKNHAVKGTLNVTYDSHVVAIVPHMHWLGKDFELVKVDKEGKRSTLIKIDRWDFNWQDTYEFEKPFPLKKGDRLEMLAHFDNSEENPSNPSKPPIDVKWGEQTADEMCIGFLQITRDDQKLVPGQIPPRPMPMMDLAPLGRLRRVFGAEEEKPK